jgi:N-acetylmuramoyl-L-alanine amidase
MLLQKIKGISIVFLICFVFTFVAASLPNSNIVEKTVGKKVEYIIDAGHGIPDGGAVGGDGTAEQSINLKIAQKIGELLNARKIAVVQTRMDENSIFTEGETIHAKKVSDIRNRVRLAMRYKNAPLISIHLNTFPNSSVRGIQVFYKDNNDQSREMAQKIQTAFNQQLQTDNAKTIKPISKSIYLFNHIENPAILIECGFISNEQELRLLKTDGYQQKIAEIIANELAQAG